MRAQIHTRARALPRLDDLYFSMLDVPWSALLLYCLLVYVLIIFLWFGIAVSTVSIDLDGTILGAHSESNPRLITLAFVSENVISMG